MNRTLSTLAFAAVVVLAVAAAVATPAFSGGRMVAGFDAESTDMAAPSGNQLLSMLASGEPDGH